MIQMSRIIAATCVVVASSTFAVPVLARSVAVDGRMKARNNCLNAVAKVVGVPGSSLKVIRQTSDASGFSLDVKVPKATAPWGCLADRQGKVVDVHFKGSEGAL